MLLVQRTAAIVLTTVVLAASGSLPSPSTLVKLQAPEAVCLDGSPATYYLSKGSNATKFLFHLQGGGWCQTITECLTRSKTALGTSIHYPAFMDLRTVDQPPAPAGHVQTGHDAFDRDEAVNPLFHDWTFVYMPYCDGNSFAGDNVSDGIHPLHFRGKRIREEVLASLRDTAGLEGATDVVVTGCSAGGAATFLHTQLIN